MQIHDLGLVLKKLTDLTAVTRLEVGNNRLKEMPSLQALPSVQHVDLSMNFISFLDGAAVPEQVTHLNISHNMIKNGSALPASSKLTEMDISFNRLATLAPLKLQSLSELQSLNCSFNALRDIGGLEGHPSLTHLFLQGNKIEDLRALTSAETAFLALQALDISANAIQEDQYLVLYHFLPRVAPKLADIFMGANPFVNKRAKDYALLLLSTNEKLKRVDGARATPHLKGMLMKRMTDASVKDLIDHTRMLYETDCKWEKQRTNMQLRLLQDLHKRVLENMSDYESEMENDLLIKAQYLKKEVEKPLNEDTIEKLQHDWKARLEEIRQMEQAHRAEEKDQEVLAMEPSTQGRVQKLVLLRKEAVTATEEWRRKKREAREAMQQEAAQENVSATQQETAPDEEKPPEEEQVGEGVDEGEGMNEIESEGD
uniref:U2A'/phosphoprotein 32 family A C-terminal domain-containing protein n=1 Tax=Vitrella brassicaformis TaxID=1169539 RepID=A0A7S1JJ71_9ALVE